MPSRAEPFRTALIAAALVALVLAAYSGVAACGFVALDDSSHVFENAAVRGGLTWDGMRRAFTEPHASLWVPLTTLSFMADVSAFGLKSAPFHLENVVWHAGASVLLFLALRELTGCAWPSALVAALFGVHPINVESVAWITERKNVLCGFFAMVTLWLWARHARSGNWRAWLGAHAAFALALLAKPMAVPLPLALLVFDAWPLRRWGAVPWGRLLGEKSVLFALAFVASRMALWATQPRGSLVTLSELPLESRITNAFTACATYLGQLVWPREFAVLYPHPVEPQWLAALAALAGLLAITALAWRLRERQPWLLAGWLFFLLLTGPTLGLVQVGSQAHGDRFTYLAQIGVFIAIVWSARAAWPVRARRWSGIAAGAALLALTASTMSQVPVWTDSVTLFEHALAVTGPHPQVLDLLAATHARRGDDAAAVRYWRASIQRLPENGPSWLSLGLALKRMGGADEAEQCFRRAIVCEPQMAAAHFQLACSLEERGSTAEARRHFREAARLSPGDATFSAALRRLGEPQRQ